MHPSRKLALGAFVIGLAGAGALGVTSMASASGASTAATVTTVVTTDDGSSAPTDAPTGTTADAPAAPTDADGDGGPAGDRGGAGGHGGHGGQHSANGITEEILTGDTAAGVEAAVTAAYPDATIDRMETDAEGAAYEAHITLADGTQSTVKLDASFTITSTESGMA